MPEPVSLPLPKKEEPIAQASKTIQLRVGRQRFGIEIVTTATQLNPEPAPVIPIQRPAREA